MKFSRYIRDVIAQTKKRNRDEKQKECPHGDRAFWIADGCSSNSL
jgi:hypothetical protein